MIRKYKQPPADPPLKDSKKDAKQMKPDAEDQVCGLLTSRCV